MEEIIVHSKGREKRWVYRSDNEIIGLYTYQPGEESLTGNIYLGRVVKVQKGLGAAFVDFGGGKNGYLHEKDIPQNIEAYHAGNDPHPIGKCVHEGQKIIVQVMKDEMGTKGARLTAVIELKGEHLVYMPQGYYVAVSKKVDDENRKVLRRLGNEWKNTQEGIVMRTNAVEVREGVLQEELHSLRSRYESLERVSLRAKCPSLLSRQDTFYEDLHEQLKKGSGGSIVVDDYESLLHLEEMSGAGIKDKWTFEHYQGHENILRHYHVASVWENALKKVVWLDNGAFIVIESTEAMTVVDVNSGKFTGKDDLEQTILQTNKLAAKEMAKQLTLRNLSGMILIDFIDMKKESNKQEVVDALSDALVSDKQRTTIVGFTPLGILELTRKRTRQPLSAYLTRPCSVCQGTGREMTPETLAFQLERELWEMQAMDGSLIEVEATGEVATVFSGLQNVHLKRLEKALGKEIKIKEITHEHPYYHVSKFI